MGECGLHVGLLLNPRNSLRNAHCGSLEDDPASTATDWLSLRLAGTTQSGRVPHKLTRPKKHLCIQ
jgi:hypothetical protein